MAPEKAAKQVGLQVLGSLTETLADWTADWT